MSITFTEPVGHIEMAPLTTDADVANLPVGGVSFSDAVHTRISSFLPHHTIQTASNFWPSTALLNRLASHDGPSRVVNCQGTELLSVNVGKGGQGVSDVSIDDESCLVLYPWHVLQVNETWLSDYGKSCVHGTIREGATIDGFLHLGSGSVVLPGVVIEGNVYIGDDCRIGPNCYIRGNTAIGDNCHIGHAVEVKNSVIMSAVSIGHLSYIGDSVIGERTNVGAGTITANFRHDGRTHKSLVGNELVDTKRYKFGTIIGADVHTGIHTSIYPGRKIWPHCTTLPGDIVTSDVRA